MAITAEAGAKIITDAVIAAQEAAAAPVAKAAVGNEFCSLWPKAKPLLELAATILPFIPGAGTVAGPVLTGLIKIGDQISAETCK